MKTSKVRLRRYEFLVGELIMTPVQHGRLGYALVE
jgi:hypothetical protein